MIREYLDKIKNINIMAKPLLHRNIEIAKCYIISISNPLYLISFLIAIPTRYEELFII